MIRHLLLISLLLITGSLSAQTVTKKLEKYPGQAYVITFLQDGNIVSGAGRETILQHWNVESGKAENPHNHPSFENTIQILPLDDHRVITLNDRGEIHVWDLNATESITLNGLKGKAATFCVSDDQSMIFAGDEYSNVAGWDLSTLEKQMQFSTGHAATSMVLSPDNKVLVTASVTGGIKAWSAIDGAEKFITQAPHHHYETLTFHHGGEYFAAGDSDGKIFIIKSDNGEVDKIINSHDGMIRNLIFHPSAPLLISASDDHKIHFWHMFTATQLAKHTAKGKGNFSIAKHPSKAILAVVSAGHSQPYLLDFSEQVTQSIKQVFHKKAVKKNVAGFPGTLEGRKVKKLETVEVTSKVLKLKIYDDDEMDGDIISLNYNGKWIVKEYKIQKKTLKLDIELEEGKSNYLILFAHNLGKIPPNTATIEYANGKEPIKLKSGLGSCGAVEIILPSN